MIRRGGSAVSEKLEEGPGTNCLQDPFSKGRGKSETGGKI